MADPDQFVITLVPLAGSIPAITRLRRALKHLRRAHGLRCVGITDTSQSGPEGDGTKGQQHAGRQGR